MEILIYFLTKIKKQFLKHGYKIKFIPFYPKKKLDMPKDRSRGSYTMVTALNKKTVFTGPVHLPWYFVFAKRINKKTNFYFIFNSCTSRNKFFSGVV